MPEELQQPTEDKIAQWKEAYGQDSVRRIQLAGSHYYYRPLNRAEFRNIMKLVPQQMNAFGAPNTEANCIDSKNSKGKFGKRTVCFRSVFWLWNYRVYMRTSKPPLDRHRNRRKIL